MRKHILAVIASMILVLALATVAMAGDPFVGTWKLNVAKSKFGPGPAPKSETVKVDAQDNGLKTVFDGIGADGKAFHFEFVAKFDGKDYPITGDPSADTLAYRKVDANTLEYVTKKGGKDVESGRIVVSKDGKTTTVTSKAKDAKGQEVTFIGVMDKQ